MGDEGSEVDWYMGWFGIEILGNSENGTFVVYSRGENYAMYRRIFLW